jgi:hypothetical protein
LVHGSYTVLGGVPLGVLLYVMHSHTTNKTRKQLISIVVGMTAALSVPLYWHHPTISQSSKWMGPFLASTFGFSTLFKSINAGFQQFPEGADGGDLQTWLCWFTLLPEPLFAKGKMSRATPAEVQTQIQTILSKLLSLFLLLTYLRNWHIYDDDHNDGEETKSLLQQHWHGMVHIWLIYLFASFCEDFSILLNLPFTKFSRWNHGFDNPLLGSSLCRSVGRAMESSRTNATQADHLCSGTTEIRLQSKSLSNSDIFWFWIAARIQFLRP